jgi:hypothetical protein
MGQASAFLRRSTNGFAHWCPGCEEMHHIAVDAPNHCGARWTFDGNLTAPTFSPSVNISSPEHTFPDGVKIDAERCHYFLKGGSLQFLGDCTHPLAGKTVPLPELPPHCRDG